MENKHDEPQASSSNYPVPFLPTKELKRQAKAAKRRKKRETVRLLPATDQIAIAALDAKILEETRRVKRLEKRLEEQQREGGAVDPEMQHRFECLTSGVFNKRIKAESVRVEREYKGKRLNDSTHSSRIAGARLALPTINKQNQTTQPTQPKP